MFLGIDEEWWRVGLDGIFGAVVGAVVGALVALMVVVLSNRHQSKLAEQALNESRDQARRQLEEHRHEAGKAREVAAMADFIASAQNLDMNKIVELDCADAYRQMNAALMRLRLAHQGVEEVYQALCYWPVRVTKLAETVKAAEQVGYPKLESIKGSLSESVTGISVYLSAWSVKSEPYARKHICAELRKISEKTDADAKSAYEMFIRDIRGRAEYRGDSAG